MKKWYGLSLAAMAASFILELLPYGAVLIFGRPDGAFNRHTYSYFSMMPFGYADFGPLLAGLLSVVVLIGAAVLFFVKGPLPALNTGMLVCNIIAILFSSLPAIMLGKDYMSDIGLIITFLLLASAAFLAVARIKLGNKPE